MRALLVLFLFAGIAAADATVPLLPSEAETNAVVERWRRAQNDGDFAAYQALYAESFTGIRRSGTHKATFDRAGWLKDRERMFKKKMTVTLDGLRLAKTLGGLAARFVQTWESGSYRDSGHKELLLVRDGDGVKIGREEQLDSRRLGTGGAPTLVVWPAKSGEAAQTAKAELERLIAPIRDIAEGALAADIVEGVGAVVAVCAEADLEPVLSTYRALSPRVESRPAPAGTAISCPTLKSNHETGSGWAWPQISETRAGKATLTLLAFQRDEEEAGDFASSYKNTLYVAVLRGPDGALLDVDTSGSGDEYTWFTDINEARGGFVIREQFVDQTCDGMNTNRQHLYERKEHFVVEGGKIASKETGTKLLQTTRCTNEEAEIYRRH